MRVFPIKSYNVAVNNLKRTVFDQYTAPLGKWVNEEDFIIESLLTQENKRSVIADALRALNDRISKFKYEFGNETSKSHMRKQRYYEDIFGKIDSSVEIPKFESRSKVMSQMPASRVRDARRTAFYDLGTRDKSEIVDDQRRLHKTIRRRIQRYM